MPIEIPVRNDMKLVIFSIVFFSEICYTPKMNGKALSFLQIQEKKKGLSVMKKTVWISAVFSLLFFLGAEEQAVWQLGKHSFSPEGTGIDAAKGVVEFNGTNAFTIPVSVLGDQKDYTIEFEIKRDPRADGKDKDHLIWMDFSDPEKQTGICLRYYPPSYNAVWLHLNDGRIEYRNFLPDAKRFYRYTFVVKDRKLQVFRDGLLLILADTVKPSVKPIRFGEIKTQAVKPYHLRNLKIYNKALFPKGFDPNVSRMRTCTGDQYTIQKADVKDPSLPRILVVGDSISMGYRSYITKHFEGRAYVDYWVGGTWFGKDAVKGENSDPKRGWRGVFSHGPYDVVSWNAMTLHMWNLNQAWRCPEESLEPNMLEMTEFLQKNFPETKFIWVRCTPVRNNLPDGTPVLENPANDRVVRYNRIVDGVMKKRGIPEVDLYAIAVSRLGTIRKGWADTVHWDSATSKLFADAIIREMEKALASHPGKSIR